MKGRRRARRTALQALYELDQSDHPLELVLAARVRDFHVASAAGAMGRAERAILARMLDAYPGEAAPQLDAAAMSDTFGVDVDAATRVASFVERLRPHVAYCVAIVRGVGRHRVAIDGVIERIAPEWPVEQMAPVDRNVLRIALWEIATASSPVRVAISEAVELARAFSGEGARRMVNGALGTYASGDQQLVLAKQAAKNRGSVGP